MNDLWFFNPADHQWTWVSGSSTADQFGVYGTKGVPDASTIPGARHCSASWIDGGGKLWLFGGWGRTGTPGFFRLNDLWSFNPATSEWTWVSGTDQYEDFGEYGTKGMPSVLNIPWARGNAVSWIDGDGKFWLFGGYTWPVLEYRWIFNDLWRFDPTTLEWTWISGSEWPDELGYYGTKGVPDDRNIPGARAGCASWIDSDGNFWVFGGTGYHSQGYGVVLNDLWRFDPKTIEWTWRAVAISVMKGVSMAQRT
ncbi:MAG: kelch repeat-containing protein [Candidatus Moduliflexus flocculans]|nr:kelch repeat-containing protein [Candidatus Moduliflexus flocculans]